METLPGQFVHDLFFSYGRVDDQGTEDQPGWVSVFVEDLKRRLSERLGRKEAFSVWRDVENLPGNVDISAEISSAVASSACLLVILSPGYMKSDWCSRERFDFLKWINDRDADARSKIFIVERDWISQQEIPLEFRNLWRYRFWTGSPDNKSSMPRPLDKERPSDRDEYKDQVNCVALAIESELSRLKTANTITTKSPTNAQASQPTPVQTDSLTVFLAEVTDDLRPQWKKLRSELDQRGIRVVSGGPPSAATETEVAVREALKESQLFVQLLSQFPGQLLPSGQETYAILQSRLAIRAEKTMLQWRVPTLTEEYYDKQDVDDPDVAKTHRQLLFGQVRAEQFEDFKKHVVTTVTIPPRKLSNRGMAFITFNRANSDPELVEKMCCCLASRGIGIVTPLGDDEAEPDQIRSDFEQAVLQSQYWLVLYGDLRQKFWVRGQINEINQLLCEHERQIGSIHLCAGPPAPKETESPLKLVGIQLPRMKVFDCQGGFDASAFLTYLEAELAVPAMNSTIPSRKLTSQIVN